MKHFALATALATAALTAPAFAVVAPTTSYTFTGICEDCNTSGSTATAVLTLADYTPGTDLKNSNFVSFSYNSDKVDFQSSNFFLVSNDISGNIGSAPGYYDFSYSEDLFGIFKLNSFKTSSDGTWNYSVNQLDLDHGTAGTWNAGTSAVPEPASWAMMIGGVGFAGVAMRRKRSVTIAYA